MSELDLLEFLYKAKVRRPRLWRWGGKAHSYLQENSLNHDELAAGGNRGTNAQMRYVAAPRAT